MVVDDQATQISATVSIGCSEVRHEKLETEVTVLKRADAALFEAKRTGRNRVVSEPADALKHA